MRTQATPGLEVDKAFDTDSEDRKRFLENNRCVQVLKAHDRQGTSDTQVISGVHGISMTLGDLRALVEMV
jgi:hypothetical protein